MAESAADRDLTRAALTGAFDPNQIIPTGAADRGARLRALAAVATEVPVTIRTPFAADAPVAVRWLWRLTPDGQRAGLTRLPVGHARAALLRSLPEADDPMAEALRLLLQGGRKAPEIARRRKSPPDPKDLPRLLQLMQAVELLRSAGVALAGWAADPGLAKWLSRVAVGADKQAASEQILPWKLHGRRAELGALARFATAGEVAMPPFEPFDSNLTPGPTAPPTVIVSGLGGSGKSALLEALRRRLARDRSILQVTFDLDLPALRAGQRVALTLELLRQIGQARPELEAQLSTIRQTLRGGVASTTEGIDPSREASAVYATLTDLNGLLMAGGQAEAIRLALIFDTFEEAVTLGPDRVRLIADWINLVGANRLNPCVILSGREASSLTQADLPGLAVQGTLPLGDLSPAGGRALLREQFRNRKIEAEDLVAQLVKVFGSDPLSLVMLARFADGIGKEGGDSRAALADLAKGERSAARERLDGEARQTFLLSRILNRLPTDLQKVASPGLVLRQVTPQLILEVLAGPCKLEPLTLPEAEALFDRLDDMIWLVQRTSDTERIAVHVPALRRRMLPQLLPDETAKAVIAEAVRWYEARAAAGEAGADLEAVYYRALGDPASLPDDPDVLRQLWDHLGPNVEDLDFARDRFRDALGLVVGRATVDRLQPGVARKGARDRRRKMQMSEGLESAVLEEATAAGEIDAGAEAAGGPMPVDLVSARFAALDLAEVAAEAPRLARELLDGIVASSQPNSDRTAEEVQALSVAALQAATACLSPDVAQTQRVELAAALNDWMQDTRGQSLLMESYGGVLRQSPQLWPAKLVGVLVLSPAGGEAPGALGEVVPEAVHGMARVSHSPYAWRALRAVGTLREDAEVKVVSLAYLDPGVLNPLVEGRMLPEGSEASRLLGSFRGATGQLSISDHNRVDALLLREEVTLTKALPGFGQRAESVPGRLPEFHGAFRLLLGRGEVSPVQVQAAVSEAAQAVPWWPKELRGEAFAEAPFSPTLVSSLIDTADRCGLLPDLAGAMARQGDANTAWQRLASLMQATVAHYRQAAGLAR